MVTSDPTCWASPARENLMREHEPDCGLGCVKHDRIRRVATDPKCPPCHSRPQWTSRLSCLCGGQARFYSTHSNMEYDPTPRAKMLPVPPSHLSYVPFCINSRLTPLGLSELHSCLD